MRVTVCICTRNRGARILTTLHSLAQSTYKNFNIIIVDQSSNDETERAVLDYLFGCENCTYLRSDSRGSSAAHNIALAHATSPLIAFTDDDCEVAPDWLARIVGHFQAHPEVGQLCGEVLAGPHDPAQGFIPTCHIPRQQKIRSPWRKWREHGIGANMAFRLDVLRAVGPFDELLGSGSVLHACLDGDMTYRVLRAGFIVLCAPDVRVIHHGFRTFAQGREMMPRVGRGVAAAYMKHLRLGDPAILPTLLAEWLLCIEWRRALLLRRSIGARRFLAYTSGLFSSFRYPIDRATRLYQPPSTIPLHTAQPITPALRATAPPRGH